MILSISKNKTKYFFAFYLAFSRALITMEVHVIYHRKNLKSEKHMCLLFKLKRYNIIVTNVS